MSQIKVIQEANANTSTTSVENLTISLTGTTAGNTLIATYLGNANNSIESITDTQGLTWQIMQGAIVDSSASRVLECWVAENIPGGNITVTINRGYADGQYGLFLTEIGPATPVSLDGYIAADQSSSGTGVSNITTGSGSSSTNASEPALIWSICYLQAGGALSAGTGFTPITTVSASSSVGGLLLTESQRITGTGAQAATFSSTASGVALTYMVILDENSSGAPASYAINTAMEF